MRTELADGWAHRIQALQEAAARSGLPGATALTAAIARAAADDVCTVAVLGEWSRGKSTLVNTLIERDLLPVDVRPTTASLVSIRSGTPERALVWPASGMPLELPLHANALRHAQTAATGGLETARRVELELFAPDLEGLCLVDTPGVNDLGDTAAEIVYGLLPFVDLAVFVLDATNGGMSRSEKDFLEADLLGPLLPPLAFVVNQMDRVEAEDERELEELRAEIRAQVRAVAGPDAPVLFGSARGALGRELRHALLATIRDVAASSVTIRRRRLVQRGRGHLADLLADRRSDLAMDDVALERKAALVRGGDSALPAALGDFRRHVRKVGEDPLRVMLARSLAVHGERTAAEIERRVAMAGDLAAYARHGLVHDVTEASRQWAQGHIPELTTYLGRHLAYLSAEFEANFGAAFGRSGGLRIRIPEAEPLPCVDVASIDRRQREAEHARFILPGLFSVVGGLIALPVGVAGLYIGMKIAADSRESHREALRAELQETARELVRREEARLRAGCEAMLDAYFADLDRQIDRACGQVIEDTRRRLRGVNEERRAGAAAQAAALARIDAAEVLLDTLDGSRRGSDAG